MDQENLREFVENIKCIFSTMHRFKMSFQRAYKASGKKMSIENFIIDLDTQVWRSLKVKFFGMIYLTKITLIIFYKIPIFHSTAELIPFPNYK